MQWPKLTPPCVWMATCLFVPLTGSAGEFPQFRHRVIDPDCGKVCYAVTVADVDGDSRDDIVAVTENRVLWYRAPDWTRHTIIEDRTERDNVCIAAHDIDGDGRIDFALGAGWTKVGTIQWLTRKHGSDTDWQIHAIDTEPWLHRMRFADVLRTGTPQLVISPLNRTTGPGVRLTAFEIPANPRTDRWRRTLLDGELNRMHNHWHADVDGNGTIDTLTASREGIHLIRRRTSGGFRRSKLSSGVISSVPNKSGAGEIKFGTHDNGRRFIATVEPMHGNNVVVYTKSSPSISQWNRQVLADTLARGHALWLANLDDDPADELIVGHSDRSTGPVPGPALYVFDADDDGGASWSQHLIDDGGVAVEDVVAADLNGDGRVDIVAGGRATHNIKLYLNHD